MATYNTPSDSANTAVRAFLTKMGESYWGKSYNTGSGTSKSIYLRIKNEIFESTCVYCGESNKQLQIEHLIMFNRDQCGLHHPGNTVPTCVSCNKRKKSEEGSYLSWDKHLEQICKGLGQEHMIQIRKEKIESHMNTGEFKYPQLNESEVNALHVIANSLYENIKAEIVKSLDLYADLDKVFVKRDV